MESSASVCENALYIVAILCPVVLQPDGDEGCATSAQAATELLVMYVVWEEEPRR